MDEPARPFTVACVQFTAGPDPDPNIAIVADLIRRARDAGADFIMTPEASNFIEGGSRRREKARREADDPFLAAMREVARETGGLDPGRIAGHRSRTGEPGAGDGETRTSPTARSSIDAQGGIVAKYDKIHLFDIDLPNGESIRRKLTPTAWASRSVIAETPWGRLGA